MAYLFPAWPAPDWLAAVSTLRYAAKGQSDGPFDNFNLGSHVGDRPEAVSANRHWLAQQLALPAEPYWLNQVHGNKVVLAESCPPLQPPEADACVAFEPGQVCVIMTADCLPILVCDLRQRQVAAIHAGWRSLQLGVVEATFDKLKAQPEDLMVWLGPAIGPDAFEIGPEVRQQLLAAQPQAESAFHTGQGDRWLADLPQLARLRLQQLGISQIYASNLCTYSQPERFFSFRREGQTGRMASLIWIRND